MKTNGLMVLGAVVIGLFWAFAGERVRLREGLGWDGARYAAWVQNFPTRVLKKGAVNRLHVQRILPSGIAYATLTALGVERSAPNIVRFFVAYNAFLLVLIVAMWGALAASAGIAAPARWLGFVMLCFNYDVLKSLSYTVVTNDGTALALGMAVLYFYWIGRSVPLLLCLLVSQFVWPITLYGSAALLFLFPRGQEPVQEGLSETKRLIVAGALGALVTGVAIFAIVHEQDHYLPERVDHPWGPLSVLILGAYLASALYWLGNWRHLFDGRAWLARFRTPRLAVLLACVGAVIAVQKYLAAPGTPKMSQVYLALATVSGAVKPGLFLVAHVAFFGPGLLLAACFWREICRFVHDAGVGLTLYAMAMVAVGLMSETRSALVNFFPLLVLGVAKVVDGLAWPRRYFVGFALVSLVWSKVWMRVDWRGDEHLGLITHGPWMTTPFYLAHLAALLVTLGLFWPLTASYFRTIRSSR